MDEPPLPSRAWEVFRIFLLQGLTAFGGPLAQSARFQQVFVERRGWLSESAFNDLAAIAHLLPGSASTQLGMAIGLRRAGYPGLLAAWVGFALPVSLAMIALGLFAPLLEGGWRDGLIHGLQIASAGIVLSAVIAMARSLAVGPVRAGMAIGATVGLTIAQGPGALILAMIAGATFGVALLREPAAEAPSGEITPAKPSAPAIVALAIFGLLLACLPFLANALGDPIVGLASVFYRAGVLAFGSEHLVLPLLQADVVARGWVGEHLFLAGYGAMQALPGPLFGFAGFVGALSGGWPAGLAAAAAAFLPGLLLTVGVQPWQAHIRQHPAARAALAGVNATAVGVLAAALWNPLLSNTVQQPGDWAMVAAVYVFIAVARLPSWLVVIGFAALSSIFIR